MNSKFLFGIGICALMLVGAGCVQQSTPVSETPPSQPWVLSFGLPDGWIVTEGCVRNGERVGCGDDIADSQTAPELDTEIDANAESVFIQNTVKLPLFGGIAPGSSVQDRYQGDNVAVIDAVRLDNSAPVPPSDVLATENLGGGFFKVTVCDVAATPECEIYGGSPHEYYLETDSGHKYHFTVRSVGVPAQEIDKIILSASEPTR